MEKGIPTDGTAVIFDDHKIFASSFSMFLQRTRLFSSVHSFETQDDLIDFFVQTPPENVFFFLDYFIPQCNTVYLMSDVKKFCPSVKIIIISSLTNASLVTKILSNKVVNGFISKTDGAEEVLACLKAIYSKKTYYSQTIAGIIAVDPTTWPNLDLTSRELEILAYLSWSKTVDQIASELDLSKHTVITHRKNLLTKSGCHSVTELVAYALRAGLIDGTELPINNKDA